MRDHRPDEEGKPRQPIFADITRGVESHSTRHPGSVKRAPKNKARAKRKRAKVARRRNR